MNTHDVISESDLYDGYNASLTMDRFGKAQSAISLNYGYYKLPSGVYFNSDFSFLAWVKLKEITHWARILDVSNLGPVDNVIFAFNQERTGGIHYSSIIGTVWSSHQTQSKFTLNKWQHIAFVLNYPNHYIYLDGVLISLTTNSKVPNNVIRSNNFVGKSTFPGDKNAVADLDELKIFKRALTQQEIEFEMNNEIFN
jgi:arabinan endo-1,5-alpha-L-arabinosidase